MRLQGRSRTDGSGGALLIKFVIRPLPPSPNVRERLHWSARDRLNVDIAWRVLVAVQLSLKSPSRPSYGKVTIHATRYAIRFMDRDNFTGSLKPVIDGLVDCKIIPDDDTSVVWLGDLKQVRVRKQVEQRLEVMVEKKE